MLNKVSHSASLFFKEQRERNNDLEKVIENGTQKHWAFDKLSEDLFAELYEDAPPEKGDLPLGLRVAAQALQTMRALNEYAVLKSVTKYNPMLTGEALVSVGEKLKDFLPVVKNNPAKLQEESQFADELYGLTGNDEYKDIANNKKKEALETEEYLQKIHNRVMDDTQCRQKVRGLLQKAIEEVSEIEDMLHSFGYSSGDSTGINPKDNFEEKLKLVKKLRESNKVREIAKIAGRLVMIAKKQQKEKMTTHEVHSVELGDTLPRVLPTEFAMLGSDITSILFYKNFVEKNLMQYDITNNVPAGKGPIIYIMDGSASMSGTREIQSKALGMALLEIAREQKRDFVMAQFGSIHQYREAIFYANGMMNVNGEIAPYNWLGLINELEFFFDGDTAFEPSLRRAMEHINGSQFDKADIIFATDGVAQVSDKFIAQYKKVKEIKKFSCLGILIGNRSNVLDKFCDEVVNCDELIDSSITNKAFSI